MTNCWPEGALRAYLDRELSAAEITAIEEHLAGCVQCSERYAGLAGRAGLVSALLETLAEPEPFIRPLPVPPRTVPGWLWPGAAVALAAGLAIAGMVVQRRPAPVPVASHYTPPPPAVAEEAVVRDVPPVMPAPAAPPAPAPAVRVARRKPTASPAMDYFVALDDQPIESGVIMRLAIQPGNAQADIVFDPAGRARAIRLVSDKQ